MVENLSAKLPQCKALPEGAGGSPIVANRGRGILPLPDWIVFRRGKMPLPWGLAIFECAKGAKFYSPVRRAG